MIRKLQVKFVIINMAMITVMLCVIFGLVYNFTRNNLEAESITMMKAIAADPFRLGRPNDPSSDLRLPYFTLQLGLRGEIISTGGGYYDLSDKEFLRDLIEQSAGSARDTGILEAHDLRFCRVSTPRGTVLVFADMSSENTTLKNLLQTSAIIGVFSFLVFLAISIFLARWAVRPVAEAWLRQKQFVADASHELKTPLTVIMTNAELLQGDEYSPAERKNFSRGILTMSQQMKLLVEHMLELARSDAEQARPSMLPVDFSRLVLDSALSFEGVFVENGLTLETSADPGITVQGNQQALLQVVDILLDNARKYSTPGGETTVSLRSAGAGKCRLKVSNPGPEIPAEELKKIFQRFYRMDKARSRDGSFGLGLSIAESIVAQHKGKLWAESKNGQNTFTVELKAHIGS
ncbi:MAG: HAMP domain-containing histidine kinase [Clostridia bacterium]|nr:HAMP domain-containing histidine kinase [Clostridia bacterium]